MSIQPEPQWVIDSLRLQLSESNYSLAKIEAVANQLNEKVQSLEKELEGYRENGPVVEPTEVYQND